MEHNQSKIYEQDYFMGQYSQWLQYRAIDQQLQAQRARLEQNLHDLQEQAHNLEVHDYHAPNSIIQALQQYLHAEPRLTALSPDAPSTHYLPAPTHTISTTITVISPVYPRPQWTPSPDMMNPRRFTTLRAAQLMPVTASPASRTTPNSRALQLASSRYLIPAQHTSPQEALRYTGHTRPTHRALPVDPQDKHTDQMVQRWLERWGKHQQNQQNTQDTQDE
jgi:hypothetical protein